VSETVILCEGYHDRAFWSGLLEYAGCTNLARESGAKPIKVRDPFGIPVGGGDFGFGSRSGAFVRVRPCRGPVLGPAKTRLAERATKSLSRLVLNIDPDTDAADQDSTGGANQQTLLQLARQFDPVFATSLLGCTIDQGATEICLVRWECADPPAPGIPHQQTLERLVCSAVCAAYPERATSVQHWLDNRPNVAVAGVKEHAWSHMAGWYAIHGCEAFYSMLWQDPLVASELRARLEASGAWAIIEAITA